MEWARGGRRRCGGRLLETKEKVENQQHEEERCWCYCEGVHSLLETSEAIIDTTTSSCNVRENRDQNRILIS